jgi:hypothetical protein
MYPMTHTPVLAAMSRQREWLLFGRVTAGDGSQPENRTDGREVDAGVLFGIQKNPCACE